MAVDGNLTRRERQEVNYIYLIAGLLCILYLYAV